MPSQLVEVYWSMSYTDLKTAISLKSEEKLVDTMQMFETLALVVSQALGGKDSSQSSSTNAPQTADELERALMRALG